MNEIGKKIKKIAVSLAENLKFNKKFKVKMQKAPYSIGNMGLYLF